MLASTIEGKEPSNEPLDGTGRSIGSGIGISGSEYTGVVGSNGDLGVGGIESGGTELLERVDVSFLSIEFTLLPPVVPSTL